MAEFDSPHHFQKQLTQKNMKLPITLHVQMSDGQEFTDCIYLHEQVCSADAIRESIHIRAKSRGYKGIADVETAEAIITL